MLFGPISCKLAGVLEKFELEFLLEVRLVDLLLFFLGLFLVDLVTFLDSRDGGDGPALALVLVLALALVLVLVLVLVLLLSLIDITVPAVVVIPFIHIGRNLFGLSLQLQAHLCGMPYLVALETAVLILIVAFNLLVHLNVHVCEAKAKKK